MPRQDGSIWGQVAAVAIAAVAVGLLDAALVWMGIGGASGAFQFVPIRIWIVAPLVWLLVACAVSLIVLPLMRQWGGVCVMAAIVVLAAAIRLQGHPVGLAAVLAGSVALLAIAARPLIRWMARPHRAIAVCLIGGVCAAGAATTLEARRPQPAATLDALAPNVIVVFLDTVRYDAVFDAAGQVSTDLPALARLRAEGTAFTRAYSTSPWTLPAHLSAVTGLPAHQLGVSFDSQVYDRRDETLAERLRRRGYRTAAVISNSFLNAGSGFARGFDTFEQAEAGLDLCRTAPGLVADRSWPWFSASVCNWTASHVTRRALRLMDDTKGSFFLALNYMDTHDPYFVERACGEANGYAAALRCLDRSLAPIVAWRSPRRPTVLALVGDHGEQFGEHGLAHHGNSVYVQLLHVPLIVRPAVGGGPRTDTRPISIAALPALVGASATGPQGETPVSAVLHPPSATRLSSQWAATDGAWYLIARERGPDSLYFLPADPAQEKDLAASPPADPAIARLRSAIAEMRREPEPDLRRFRSLGYLQ